MSYPPPAGSSVDHCSTAPLLIAKTRFPRRDERTSAEPATIAACSTSENRKQLATGSFTSRGPSSRYSLSGGCFGCTYCECTQNLSAAVDDYRELRQLTRRSDLFLNGHEWRFGMKSRLLLLSWIMLSVFLYGQQVVQIDLVAHQIPKQVANANFDTAVAGCESPSYKHSDGATLETKGRPKLTLELAPAKQIVHQRETVLTN